MDTDIREEIEKFVSTAWDQITNDSTGASGNTPTESDIYFTQNFQQMAQTHGLSENDALDVYHNGESAGEGKLVRAYGDYEVGITYFIDPGNGRTVITSIWKQGIRV